MHRSGTRQSEPKSSHQNQMTVFILYARPFILIHCISLKMCQMIINGAFKKMSPKSSELSGIQMILKFS